MYASRHAHLTIVKFLVGIGANVNATNDVGDTALMIAIARDHLEIVKLLRVHGAK